MIKTKAIVLSKKDINDYDGLICFYTLDFGKINLIAKGIKRPSSKLIGHLDVFNLVDLMIIKGKERDYVGSVISENSFLNIKSDYRRTLLAGQGLRFLRDLTFSNQPDFNIFLNLKDFLLNLDFSSDNSEALVLFFKLKILENLGYDLDFAKCSECDSVDSLYFNFFDKEFLCQKCILKKGIYSNNLIKISQTVLNLKKDILSSELIELKKFTLEDIHQKELETFISIIKKII
ncbi:MAG TPA: DNA repair protein RecO [bacterium]|nr:DNA repair protein RecO [bacterium]